VGLRGAFFSGVDAVPVQGTRITSLSVTMIEGLCHHHSLRAVPNGSGPAHLVPPAQEAGRADQHGSRRDDTYEAMDRLAYADLLPFADHLARSNRFAREVAAAMLPFAAPFDLALTTTYRPQLEKDKMTLLVTNGNARDGHTPVGSACAHTAHTPVTQQILAVPRAGLCVVQLQCAYQLRPVVASGRLINLLV
jgi:hypothetical protein